MNRRENHVVTVIARKAEGRAAVKRLRDLAQDAVAAPMKDITCPAERAVLAREMTTWAAALHAQAAGHVAAGAHLASLSGQVFAVGEKIAGAKQR